MSSVSKIILGTVQFGLDYGINNDSGKPNEQQVETILLKAYQSGVVNLDSAEAYGNAHEVIGNFHRNKPKTKFNISTKFSPKREDLSSNIRTRVLENIETLQVDHLESYMFHTFSDYKAYYSKFEKELLKLVEEGFIKRIGVSLHSNKEILEVIQNKNIKLIQLPYNLFDNKSKRETTLQQVKAKGIEIHTRSVFLQGLFFKKSENLTGNLVALKNNLEEISNISTQKNISMADLALNYAINSTCIDNVLLGVDSVNQLEVNLQALKSTSIAKEVYTAIDKIAVNDVALLNPANWKIQ